MFGGVSTAAQLMVKVGADVADAQNKLRGVSSSLQNMGGAAMKAGGMMTLGVTGPLAAAGALITSLASDLEESANKTKVVFGEQAAAIQAWAETSAEAFGLSTQQALEAAGTFGNLFTSMGVAGEQSADMSQGLIELAADLASFNNIDPTVALEKLRAGLLGEAEPLRTLGVNLSAAATETKALEMGLAGTAKELTDADKAAARYAIIMEQTALAQGDFARTSDGLANQMRTVKAKFADAGAQLGTVLLPYITQFVGWISNLISYFTNLDPEMQKWIVAIGVVVAAIGPAIAIVGALATALGVLLSPIGLVIAGVAALVVAWQTNFMGIRDAVQPAIDSFLHLIEVIGWGIEDSWSVVEWIEVLSSKFPLLGEAIGIVIGAFTLAKDAALQLWTDWQSTFTQILSLVSSVFYQIWEIIQTVLGIIIASVQQNAGAVQALFLNAYTKLKDIVQESLTAVASIVQSLLGAVKQFLETHGTDIQNTLADAWLRIATIINMALDVIKAVVIPIFQGIAQFLKEHGDEIQTVLSAAWEIIKNVIDGALTLIEGIFGAALAILKGDWSGAWEIIKETVRSVWENIKNILNAATTAMVTVIGTTLLTIYNWFVEKFEAIKGYLQGIDLGAVGAAIIQGLINGIISMAGALVDAARGVVQSAIDAAKNLLGIKSPSTVFREIGRSTVEGFVLGVLSMASQVAAAVEEAFDEGLRGAIETLATVADALSRVMKAMQDLAGYGGVPDLAGKLQTLVSNIRTVIAELKLLAEYFAQDDSGIWSAKAVLDPLAAIFDNLGRVVDAFAQIADLEITAANITLFAQNLRTLLPELVNALVDAAAAINLEGLPAAVIFAQAAGDVLSVMRDAVEGLTAAMTFVLPETDNIDVFFNALRFFVARLQTMASQMGWKVFDDAIKFAEAAGKIAVPLKAAIAGLVAAMSFVLPETDNIDVFFNALRFFVARLQTMASQMGWKVFDDAIKFAEAAGKISTALKKGLDLLLDLASYAGPSEDQINAFMRDLQFVFERLARWIVFVMAPIAAQVGEEMVDLMAGMMDGLAAAVDVLTALADYVTPGETAIQAFTADYQALFEEFKDWATRPSFGTAGGTLAQIPPALATLFRDVMTGLAAAIAVLTALVDYVSPGEMAIQAFTRDYSDLFQRFATWAAGAFADVALDIVAAVGETVGIVFDGLGSAVTTLQAMTYYVGPTTANIDRFMADMEQVMIRLRDWALGSFTTESMAFLQAFGEMAGVVFSALGQALDLMSGIADYTVTGSAFDLALQRFNADLFRMITSWRIWIVDIMEPETLALVAQFATVMGAIVAGFRDALNLLMDIENANLPTSDQLQAFLDMLTTLLAAVVSDIGGIAQAIDDEIAAAQASFGAMGQALGSTAWADGYYVATMFMRGLRAGMQDVGSINLILTAMNTLALQLKDVLMAAWGISSPSKVAMRIGEQFVAGLAVGLRDLQGIPSMIEDSVGLVMSNNVRIEPAPQRAYLTVAFEGAWQSGMSQAEERRITGAMVGELRRQGLVIAAR